MHERCCSGVRQCDAVRLQRGQERTLQRAVMSVLVIDQHQSPPLSPCVVVAHCGSVTVGLSGCSAAVKADWASGVSRIAVGCRPLPHCNAAATGLHHSDRPPRPRPLRLSAHCRTVTHTSWRRCTHASHVCSVSAQHSGQPGYSKDNGVGLLPSVLDWNVLTAFDTGRQCLLADCELDRRSHVQEDLRRAASSGEQ